MEGTAMTWYNGSVKQAVEHVKCTNSLLLVFVQGEDEVSNKYAKFLENGIPLQHMDYIAIKIPRNSMAFEQFQKIYVTVPIPSVFLIGSNGRPISVFCAEDPRNLIQVFKEAAENQEKVPEESGVRANQTSPDKARIQFRLPSDEVRSWDFPSRSTLRDVRLYLMETVQIRTGFKLLRVYPRTVFTTDDEARTLEDLSLTPTSTLIVVPVQGIVQTSIKNIIARTSMILTFLTAICRPLLTVVDYFKSLLSNPKQRKIMLDKKRRGESASKRFCKKNPTDNVHSFAFDDSDTDSDMNTDNGNSTQQM